MITRLDNEKGRMEYISLLHPHTLIDVIERPDDDEKIHTYVATGNYQATMADHRMFSGKALEFMSSLGYYESIKL
jgi:hypothetical protein